MQIENNKIGRKDMNTCAFAASHGLQYFFNVNQTTLI